MSRNFSRREILGAVGAGLALPFLSNLTFPFESSIAEEERRFAIRTITAGIELDGPSDLAELRKAIAFLNAARSRFQADDYVVQTIRIATQSLSRYAADWMSDATLEQVLALDAIAVEGGIMFNIGPVITGNDHPDGFGNWAARVIQSTTNTSLTVNVASKEGGIHQRSVAAAAEAIYEIARQTDGGEGNFRFAAIAHSPVGTPFYPAAFHAGPDSFAVGLESPNVLTDAVEATSDPTGYTAAMTRALDDVLRPIAAIAEEISDESGWPYDGVDVSPAPGKEASVGHTIETITGTPFGSASTLSACAQITDAIKAVSVKTCGYNGLMLPPLEDPVLAARLSEGRYGPQELLLYSSVCGTGLDVVPMAGSTPLTAIEGLLMDVAALAHKWDKPLSARLFPIPGKEVGDLVQFDNPFLVDTRIPPLD